MRSWGMKQLCGFMVRRKGMERKGNMERKGKEIWKGKRKRKRKKVCLVWDRK